MNAKKCGNCKVRPIAGGKVRGQGDTDRSAARNAELCLPCLAEAGWENEHSDYGHDVDGPSIPNDFGATSGGRVDSCWICHPELNEASATYVPRTGTSRVGMRMTVPVRASGVEKANAVLAKLPEGYAANVTKPTKRNNYVTTLKAAKSVDDGIILQWDANGRFLYGPSTANGKKVRNVSGALRALGV